VAARHVDIVSIEPLAGEPRLLARVVLNGGPGLEVDMMPGRTDEQQMWRYLRSRVQVDPNADPLAFLEELGSAIDSTYVGASDIHDEAHCPFCAHGSVRELTRPLGPLPA
jgi:hypothetical protein